ncbi:50S ribosomal protein L24 [Candidatus Bathyarchaeota archaeon]|nr:50S ribosomal protein L24 [Candidatus Bathyarchaeota archaeon]
MASSKPTKQRKLRFQAANHKLRKMLSSHLSDDLTGRYKVRKIPLRAGDRVRVMRGEFAGLEGKVERVEYSTGRLFVEGMSREKAAGISSKLPVHSSKVIITELNLSDKWRSGILSEKSKLGEA